jgi:hypothetical protein
MFHPISGASNGGHDPTRRLRNGFTIWITPSQGETCDACGNAIPGYEPQYEVVISGREMRLDRDCFRRRVEEIT